MLLRALAATGVATSLFGSSAFGGSPPPPPDRIVIDSVAATGSGCPTGTASVAVSPDNTAFTVTYSNYLARVGPGASPTDFQKDCQLNLSVHVPGGFTYAIVSAGYNGFASLAPGASGTQRASYHFQGDPRTTNSTHHFKGGFNNDWQTSDTVDVAALVFAPCGEERSLDIDTQLQVERGTSSPNATSLMEMDSTDGRINTVYRLALKQCH
ncbi:MULTISPECIES: DUF4360 domain-containing protein [Kitasatospora]|uniref:DUF4360 domain-containing protein n=1 Tax=Kitasatospora cathayae TaxID=3004092 RepID=A0ABY7QFH0_9ACTN|nr:DUF4360 domain-containing protein [Kitasatospora sp. HUAS 3-15]WBP91144.1 DUF4360 domain-containing protein [Kitasatospora sp. HUAS 3-15]